MEKNLRTADALVKVILASMTIVLYSTGVISGPLAILLLIVSLAVVLRLVLQFMFTFITRD